MKKSTNKLKSSWQQAEQEALGNKLMTEPFKEEQGKQELGGELLLAVTRTQESCRVFLENLSSKEKTRNIPVWFSMGKDSLCVVQKLKEWGFNPVLFWYCVFPDLDFQSASLDFYETFFDTKIHRLLGPSIYKFHWAGTYMTHDYLPVLNNLNSPNLDFTDLQDYVIEDYQKDMNLMSYNAIGLRAADSFNRRKVFEKFGYFNHNLQKAYPIIEYKIDDIKDTLLKNNISLPIDYRIWGRTFDGMHYYFLKGLKDNFPQDYEKVLFYCPLAEMEILRIEHYFPNDKSFRPQKSSIDRWKNFKIL